AAILVHSLVDFSLRMPANLLLFFVVAALLLFDRPLAPARTRYPSWSVAALLALLCLAAVPVIGNRVLAIAGDAPIDPSALLVAADRALAEDGDREHAIALAR